MSVAQNCLGPSRLEIVAGPQPVQEKTNVNFINWSLNVAGLFMLHAKNLCLTLEATTLKQFLRATAGTAIARLSHRNSVCPSVRPSVCHTGGSGKNGAS